MKRYVSVGSTVRWFRGRWELFLGYVAVTLVVAFMLFYVNGRQFFLGHHLSLPQADGSVIRTLSFLPAQSDITTIISILASSARLSSTLWVIGIDLRFVFLFLSMERGGVTFEGLKSLIAGWPDYRQFRQKRNFILFVVLQVAIFMSSFTSSVVSGSVTWKPDYKYLPGQAIAQFPLCRSGDRVGSAIDPRFLESLLGYSISVYSIFYGTGSSSSSIQRLLPYTVGPLPYGTKLEELTVPYFVTDSFEWIRDPKTYLSSHDDQRAAATVFNRTGPHIMNMNKWGLIPDGNWGPFERTFPAPHRVSESRILVVWLNLQKVSNCTLPPTVPPDVQPYIASFANRTSCFLFANVTYRAGAARCRTCQLLGPNVIRNTGDLNDLQLIDDPTTSTALAMAPYVATTMVETGFALPPLADFPTYQNSTIEILSRSYQVAWNALNSEYGMGNESSGVFIAVAAPTASVVMLRVVLWGILHVILLALGFMFRHIHTSGYHPWIEDPAVAALLVDPTDLTSDPSAWSRAKDAPYMKASLKLQEEGNRKYIVLEREKEFDLETEEYGSLLHGANGRG